MEDEELRRSKGQQVGRAANLHGIQKQNAFENQAYLLKRLKSVYNPLCFHYKCNYKLGSSIRSNGKSKSVKPVQLSLFYSISKE